MTYVENELLPRGFRLISREEESHLVRRVVLSISHLKLQFDCCCPDYPNIRALGCSVHHQGPGGSWPVEIAKKIPMAVGI